MHISVSAGVSITPYILMFFPDKQIYNINGPVGGSLLRQKTFLGINNSKRECKFVEPCHNYEKKG